MDSASESALLRSLIADNQNKAAAERLYQWFEGKSAGRQDASLALLSRVNALDESMLGGLISQGDADLERNRITKALLELSKQLDRTDALPNVQRPSKALLAGVAVVLLIGIALVWKMAGKNDREPETRGAFTITATLHEQGDESNRIRSGKAELVIGEIHLPVQDISSNGQAVFANIPGDYFHKPVRLVPLDIRYRVVNQSASTPAENQNITFELVRKPDITTVRGKVFLATPGSKPAAHASLDFGVGKAKGETDESGNFEMAVPYPVDTMINLTVVYKGEIRFTRTITVGRAPLIITLTQ